MGTTRTTMKSLTAAAALALGLVPLPARAGESVLGAEIYPVVGSGRATFISGWTHFHPRADQGGVCDDALQFDLRMKLKVTRVTAQELVIRSVVLEWKAVTGGNFAGYFLWAGKKNYAGGRTSDLGDPAVQPGHHSRKYAISKTVQWEQVGKAYWQQNFSFEGEEFDSGALPVPGQESIPMHFPASCQSHSIWFHIVRTNPGGGDGGCLATGKEYVVPNDKC